MRHQIKTTGEIVHIGKSTLAEIKKLINAETLDQFMMADGVHVCILDDAGHKKGLPYNHEATRRYLARCLPGTTHTIVGDVVIVPDADFASDTDFGFVAEEEVRSCTCLTPDDHHPCCPMYGMEMQS